MLLAVIKSECFIVSLPNTSAHNCVGNVFCTTEEWKNVGFISERLFPLLLFGLVPENLTINCKQTWQDKQTSNFSTSSIALDKWTGSCYSLWADYWVVLLDYQPLRLALGCWEMWLGSQQESQPSGMYASWQRHRQQSWVSWQTICRKMTRWWHFFIYQLVCSIQIAYFIIL